MKDHKTQVGVPFRRGRGYVYYLKIRDENGRKQTWFSKVFTTYEAAEADSKERQMFLSAIESKPAAMDKLSDYLNKWLKQKYYRQVKPATYAGAETNIRLHINPYLGKKKISYIEKKDVEALIDRLQKNGLSASSTIFVYHTLSKAMKQAVDDKLIVVNPCAGVALPAKIKKQRELLQKGELESFLELAKKYDIYMEVLFGLSFGLRIGEILGLQFGDFNLRRKTLVPQRQVCKGYVNDPIYSDHPVLGYVVRSSLKTKGSTGRVLNVTDQMLEVVKALKEKYIKDKIVKKNDIEKCFIFCKPDGSFRRQDYLKNRFDKLRNDFGLPKLRFHDLRHTFASILIEEGIPIASVSSALGHTSITTTYNSYYDVINGGKDIANKMGSIIGSIDNDPANVSHSRYS